MDDLGKMRAKLRLRFRDLIDCIKQENDETKEAFDLILKESRGLLLDEEGNPRGLTKKEKEFIKHQAFDVLKVIGLASLAILPGGTLALILINAFKLNDKVLPSSFKGKRK